MVTENDFTSSIDPSSLARVMADRNYIRIASKGVRNQAHRIVQSMKYRRELRDNFLNNILVDFKQDEYRQHVANIGRLYEKKLTYSTILSRRIAANVEVLKKRGPPVYKGMRTRDYVVKRHLYSELTEEERDEWREVSIGHWLADYDTTSSVCTLACQLFFGLEFACRNVCAISCKSFAHKVNKEQVIQHMEVWKTLKKLGGERNRIECAICANERSCHFKFAFMALANMYAYSSKIRMLSDYTEEPFHENRAKFRTFVNGTYLNQISNTIVRLDKLLFYAYSKFMWTPFPLDEQIRIARKIDIDR